MGGLRSKTWRRTLAAAAACLCLPGLAFSSAPPAGAVIAPLQAKPRLGKGGWLARHLETVHEARKKPYPVLLLGDSLTQGWELHHKEWERQLGATPALNAGIRSDRIEHILWRVENGLFTAAHPQVVVVMAGTNNLEFTSPPRIAAGLAQLLTAVRSRSPGSKILLFGILPRGVDAADPLREKVRQANAMVATLADGVHVFYADIGPRFLSSTGAFTHPVSADGTHLTAQGYALWAQEMRKALTPLLDGAAKS